MSVHVGINADRQRITWDNQVNPLNINLAHTSSPHFYRVNGAWDYGVCVLCGLELDHLVHRPFNVVTPIG